ncbi:MAG: hypothetical protein LQ352_003055 [Teloschistes flavicans]|nr:MAG: hypothetical protein LQ352_003055 [Teloschistes flavicans]
MTQLPPPPPGLDIHASRQASIYAASITTEALALVAVVLRFWCRKMTKTAYRLDDWLVVAAASARKVAKEGGGLHLWIQGPNFVTDFFRGLFISQILYFLLLCTVKFSILAFYKRIFATTIKIPVYILASLVLAWGVAVIIVTIFQCTPVSGFWNRNKPADCTVSDYAFFIGNAVPNIVTDLALLLLPLPFISRLHRTTSQKIALAGVFSLGSFIIIISIVRLVTLVRADLPSLDIDWNFAFVGVWTATEGNMAIVCACLPSLRPILSMAVAATPDLLRYLKDQSSRRYRSGFFAKQKLHSGSSGSHGNNRQHAGVQRGFVPLTEHSSTSDAWTGEAGHKEMEKGYGSEAGMEMHGVSDTRGGIYVRNDIRAEYT